MSGMPREDEDKRSEIEENTIAIRYEWLTHSINEGMILDMERYKA